MNKLKGFLLGLALSCSCAGMAQELNARITVNGDKIANANKSVFTTLQNALTEFINNRKWTDATFAVNERIDCSMTIIVNEMEESSFKGEIQVQARRPVYNSSYTTTLLNFRDQQFDFEYMEGEPLEYQENMLTGNLTATVTSTLSWDWISTVSHRWEALPISNKRNRSSHWRNHRAGQAGKRSTATATGML